VPTGQVAIAMSLAPPFTKETAYAKVKKAQDLWNSQDPKAITQAYTVDSIWRNRSTFIVGAAAIEEFLTQKWEKEKNYRLRKELFAFTDDKIAVQFWYGPTAFLYVRLRWLIRAGTSTKMRMTECSGSGVTDWKIGHSRTTARCASAR
jgi:hypothetical protein